jgi:hypothetical protein
MDNGFNLVSSAHAGVWLNWSHLYHLLLSLPAALPSKFSYKSAQLLCKASRHVSRHLMIFTGRDCRCGMKVNKYLLCVGLKPEILNTKLSLTKMLQRMVANVCV